MTTLRTQQPIPLKNNLLTSSLLQPNRQPNRKRNNNTNKHHQPKHNPFEPSRPSCVLNTLIELYICLLRILDNVCRLLLGRHDGGFLQYNGFGEILEELVEFGEGLFDVLDFGVAGADASQDGGCGAGAVGSELVVMWSVMIVMHGRLDNCVGEVTYCCLEHTLITPVRRRRFANLIFRSLWVDNAVLSSNLLLVSFPVLSLLILVLLQPTLEHVLQATNLTVLGDCATTSRRIRLQELDLVADPGVEDLCLRRHVFERGGGGAVGRGDGSLVQVGDLRDIVGELVDVTTGSFDTGEEVAV